MVEHFHCVHLVGQTGVASDGPFDEDEKEKNIQENCSNPDATNILTTLCPFACASTDVGCLINQALVCNSQENNGSAGFQLFIID